MTGKSPPNIDGMTSLKVGNISYRTRTLDLHHIFGKFGDVGDVYIPRDKHSKHSRGFAFVRYLHHYVTIKCYIYILLHLFRNPSNQI